MNLMYIISKIIKKINIPSIKNSEIHKKSKVCSASLIVNSSINKYSYVGNACTVVNTEIGSFCSIADNCIIGGASHPIDWLSTSPVFHNGRNILKTNFSNQEYTTTTKTNIGHDVWIGSNVIIKSGVKISDGAVIGMGSIVTKDVGPYEIWAGNSAKLIKKRFDEQTISDLIDLRWWEFEDKVIKKHASKVSNIQIAIKELKNESSLSNI